MLKKADKNPQIVSKDESSTAAPFLNNSSRVARKKTPSSENLLNLAFLRVFYLHDQAWRPAGRQVLPLYANSMILF
jgi:hypothetical protein